MKSAILNILSFCITKREYVLLLDQANGGPQEIRYIRDPIFIYAGDMCICVNVPY